jgi:hypothetical protein
MARVDGVKELLKKYPLAFANNYLDLSPDNLRLSR